MIDILPIKCALVSVYDKCHLDSLAAFFKAEDIMVISTGGTAGYLRERGLQVTDSSLVSQSQEMLDGRVKTMSHRIFASILYDRTNQKHIETVDTLEIPRIDLVVVNLYPFAQTALNAQVSMNELIEHIDIGGPSLLRAASKNHAYVTALHDPKEYISFINHYRNHGGTSLPFRQSCAHKVFTHTYRYDQTIASVLENRCTPSASSPNLTLEFSAEKQLRYGENPHQKAQVFSSLQGGGEIDVTRIKPLMGRDLSYNNLLDTHAAVWALRCLSEQQSEEQHYGVIVKHGIPCGAGLAPDTQGALTKALMGDPISAFGGIVALSGEFDLACAEKLKDGFFEIIIATHFTQCAIEFFSHKKNLRLIAINNLMRGRLDTTSYRSVFGGLLMQEHDYTAIKPELWQAVTTRKPKKIELQAMETAFRMVKATPSNAISVAYPDQLLGVGAGQPNRIQAAQLALTGAKNRGFDLSEAALASDAFFPFNDGIKLAHEYGIGLIIQPGGSMRDQEIITTANDLGLCMVFTHQRHFRH